MYVLMYVFRSICIRISIKSCNVYFLFHSLFWCLRHETWRTANHPSQHWPLHMLRACLGQRSHCCQELSNLRCCCLNSRRQLDTKVVTHTMRRFSSSYAIWKLHGKLLCYFSLYGDWLTKCVQFASHFPLMKWKN